MDRLSWLVEFVGRDLAALRPGDWLNFREDLGKFCSYEDAAGRAGVMAVQPSPANPGAVHHASKESALRAQDAVKAFLDELLPRSGHNVVPMLPRTLKLFPFRMHEALMLAVQPVSKENALAEILTGVALLELHKSGLDRVGRCAEKDCGRLFVKVGKKIYCSRACSSKAAYQAWAARQPKEELATKKKAQARKSYVARVRKKNPKLRVGTKKKGRKK